MYDFRLPKFKFEYRIQIHQSKSVNVNSATVNLSFNGKLDVTAPLP